MGKTEVGKILADRLDLTYIDTDSMIEQQQGISINDIFEKGGEESFRDMESALLDGLKSITGHVISTGGGMILRPENVKKLKSLGPLVLLWAEPEVVYKRLKDTGDRPLLNVGDPLKKIKEILESRTPVYKSVADLEVDTSSLSPEVACNRIIKFISKHKDKGK